MAIALSTAACGSSISPRTSSAGSSAQSAVGQWNTAYAFLAAQTKPTEIACNWVRNAGGTPSPAARVAEFYNFSDTGSWKSHLITRKDKLPTGVFEMCEATVPTTVPYGPGIETFLSKHGLIFGATAPGLTPIEIAYAGESASDPDIIYRHRPGLFGLRIALAQLGTSPFVARTSKIIQPADNATAARYLQYAKPLLNWYGYNG